MRTCLRAYILLDMCHSKRDYDVCIFYEHVHLSSMRDAFHNSQESVLLSECDTRVTYSQMCEYTHARGTLGQVFAEWFRTSHTSYLYATHMCVYIRRAYMCSAAVIHIAIYCRKNINASVVLSHGNTRRKAAGK